MELKIDTNQLSDATREVMGISDLFKRAERSALKSVGYMVREEMRGHIESGGRGSWPELHPVTRLFYKKYRAGNRWQSYRRGEVSRVANNKIVAIKRLNNIPLYWLGKHARYRIAENEAVVGFGKSHGDGDKGARRKTSGTMDPFLMNVLDRAESGERTSVSKNMRRFFGGTRWDNEDDQVIGGNIFPLRRSTTTLVTPKRPIIGPVLARVESKITPYFENKFWLAIERYRTGLKKT